MLDLEKLVRPNILSLKAYSSARDEYKGTKGVFLDANENPFGKLNRYPDPYQRQLKKLLGKQYNFNPSDIFIGNGSDEVIDLTFRIFCEPGKDKALTFTPTYGMYEVSAAINNVELIKLPLNKHFQIDFENLGNYLSDPLLKLIFICSPNNPTGNTIDGIQQLASKFKGVIFVDEAYQDFSSTNSLVKETENLPNLIISQTLSKAWGLAAARIGIAYSSPTIINLFNKTKPPYNVSTLNQKAAVKSLLNTKQFENNKKKILKEKQILIEQLASIKSITKVFPSDSNFLLIACTDADKVYNSLIKKKVITRNRNSVVKDCIRITVGTKAENKKLISEMKKIK